MKKLFLALAALSALSQSAFALGETKGLGNIFGGGSTGAVAMPNVTDIAGAGADVTCVRDSRDIHQAAIDARFNKAVTAQDNFQAGTIENAPGCYLMGSTAVTSATAGLTLNPAIREWMKGSVKWDFRNAPAGFRALSISSLSWPFTTSNTAMGQGAAANGFAVDGAGILGIFGKVGDPNSIGLAVGNVADSNAVEKDTKAGARNIFIQDTGWGVWFDPWDTYLNKFENITVRNPYNGCIGFADTGDGTGNNSGENMTFNNLICSGGQVVGQNSGFIYGTSGRNVTINNSSLDFNRGAAFYIPELSGFAGYGQMTGNNLHIENPDFIAMSSETQAYFMHFTLNNTYYYPGANRPGTVNVNRFDRPLINMPGVKVTLNKMYVGLNGGNYYGVTGLWFMTSATVPDGISSIDFQNQRVLIHQALVPNPNWNLISSTATVPMKFGCTLGWCVKNQTAGLNVEIISSNTVPEFGPSLNRMVLTAAGGSFADIISDIFPVTPGNRLYGWPLVHGGASNNTLNIAQTYIWYRDAPKVDVPVNSLTKSTNNLMFTVSDTTGIVTDSTVRLFNTATPGYNNMPLIVFAVGGGLVRVQVSGTLAAPTPTMLVVSGTSVVVSGTTYFTSGTLVSNTMFLRPDPVEEIGRSSTVTVDISASIYGNPSMGTCPDGTRACWAQVGNNRTATISNDLRVPAGATKARVLQNWLVSGTEPVYFLPGIYNMIP